MSDIRQDGGANGARRRRGRGRGARLLASTTAAVLTLPVFAPAAHAGGLLGTLTGTVTGVVGTTTGLVGGVTGSLLGDGNWQYTASTTSMDHVADVVGAKSMWSRGYTGKGVGVALVDTGVVPVSGLTSGNVVNGPDLSFESQADNLRDLDTFGHGTHMAGIIAGREPAGTPDRFLGVAPDSTLVSLKVAASDGAVDVSQVVAAIDWVVQHRNDNGRNIRVLNLSYGTDGTQDYRLDPLTHAVENAWRHGIVVVVAAGNEGTSAPRLANPAYDPYVLAVGAADTRATVSTTDDVTTDFTSRGDAARRLDLDAPGQSI